jgi:hypothetical protein
MLVQESSSKAANLLNSVPIKDMKTCWLFLASVGRFRSNTATSSIYSASTSTPRLVGCELDHLQREPYAVTVPVHIPVKERIPLQPPQFDTMAKTKRAAVAKGATKASANDKAKHKASSSNNDNTKPPPKSKPQKKDYAYRATWKHKLSRAKNLAKRGGMTKPEMMAKHGRFPKKNEWWGPEENEKEWLAKWTLENPKC